MIDCIHDWEDTLDPKMGYKCKKCKIETGGYQYYCDLCNMWHDVREIH